MWKFRRISNPLIFLSIARALLFISQQWCIIHSQLFVNVLPDWFDRWNRVWETQPMSRKLIVGGWYVVRSRRGSLFLFLMVKVEPCLPYGAQPTTYHTGKVNQALILNSFSHHFSYYFFLPSELNTKVFLSTKSHQNSRRLSPLLLFFAASFFQPQLLSKWVSGRRKKRKKN